MPDRANERVDELLGGAHEEAGDAGRAHRRQSSLVKAAAWMHIAGTATVKQQLKTDAVVRRLLAPTVSEEERVGRERDAEDEARARERDEVPSRRDVAGVLVPSLAAIVLGGIAVMRGALDIAARLGVSRFLVGALLLSALPGLPNVFTMVRLAQAGRGRAVVSETLNSNTLDLIVGAALPALVFGASGGGVRLELTAAWLLGATLLSLALTAAHGGLSRRGATLVIAVYLAFVVVATVTF